MRAKLTHVASTDAATGGERYRRWLGEILEVRDGTIYTDLTGIARKLPASVRRKVPELLRNPPSRPGSCDRLKVDYCVVF